MLETPLRQISRFRAGRAAITGRARWSCAVREDPLSRIPNAKFRAAGVEVVLDWPGAGDIADIGVGTPLLRHRQNRIVQRGEGASQAGFWINICKKSRPVMSGVGGPGAIWLLRTVLHWNKQEIAVIVGLSVNGGALGHTVRRG